MSQSEIGSKVGSETEKNKPPIGLSPLKLVDEERNRIDFCRAIEISQAIIRSCGDMAPWPVEWDEEMNYITNQLWKRTEVGGVDNE
jgi:hypothetical protein